jgi:hypothetical protein
VLIDRQCTAVLIDRQCTAVLIDRQCTALSVHKYSTEIFFIQKLETKTFDLLIHSERSPNIYLLPSVNIITL